MSARRFNRLSNTPVIRSLLCVFLLCVCVSANATERLVVYAVNYPLAYFAERIGGEHVEVHLPVPSGIDPAFWMPDRETIAAYQQADLILLNGAGYARWVNRVSLPQRRLVNTSAVFSNDYIESAAEVKHQHGPAGEHSHSGTAFTTWLDLSQAARQAEQVALAMKRMRPGHAGVFADNYQQLHGELMQLDGELQEIMQSRTATPLLASHPVYQYLARRYGMDLRTLTWEPDTYPDTAAWQLFESMQAERAAGWMLWENEPIRKTRERLQDSGVDIVVFKPGMNRPEQGDFMTVMQANIRSLSGLDSGPDDRAPPR